MALAVKVAPTNVKPKKQLPTVHCLPCFKCQAFIIFPPPSPTPSNETLHKPHLWSAPQNSQRTEFKSAASDPPNHSFTIFQATSLSATTLTGCPLQGKSSPMPSCPSSLTPQAKTVPRKTSWRSPGAAAGSAWGSLGDQKDLGGVVGKSKNWKSWWFYRAWGHLGIPWALMLFKEYRPEVSNKHCCELGCLECGGGGGTRNLP